MKSIHKNVGVCKACYDEIGTTGDKTFQAYGDLSLLLSPYINDGAIKDAVKQYKFSNQRIYGELFGEMIYAELKGYSWLSDYDFIMPVPLHGRRFMDRGYNQSEIITEVLSEKLGVPVCTDALFRIRDTKKQSSLTGMARKENVHGAFFAAKEVVSGKKVIIVDDIYTVGGTATECASALKQAGAIEVAAVTLLRTMH